MTPVKSSHIESVGYDEPKRTLAVKFQDGSTYHYQDVSPEKYGALVAAESPGKELFRLSKGLRAVKQ